MTMLARFADSVFWLGRYVERAENLARILDVHGAFVRDPRGTSDWSVIVDLNSDAERFDKEYDRPTASNVLQFYVLDAANPNSIAACIRGARENARTLRHVISTEMWTHLNVFHAGVKDLKRKDVRIDSLTRTCNFIKDECQRQTGISLGTLYRDEAWRFWQIGRHLERADQTTRLLDMKYRQVALVEEQPGSPVDISQWNVLLRSAAGYYAFRRTRASRMTPSETARFMLLDHSFPRSIAYSVAKVEQELRDLVRFNGLDLGEEIPVKLAAAKATLETCPADRVDADWLQHFADDMQIKIADLALAIGKRFFGYED
ncbi:MAG: alpha-E domain-containing protein [Alphaproteobacteria bacterium]|nr:alpha-E domain-containing protein [Alphaproteobacteria bacterium]